MVVLVAGILPATLAYLLGARIFASVSIYFVLALGVAFPVDRAIDNSRRRSIRIIPKSTDNISA